MENLPQKYNIESENTVIIKAFESEKIANAKDEAIYIEIFKIVRLLGLGEQKIPSNKKIKVANTEMDSELQFLINSIKKTYPTRGVLEISEAFIYAIGNKINCDLNLYDKKLNFQFIANVFNEYIKYTNEILWKKRQIEYEKQINEIIEQKSKENAKKIDFKKHILSMFKRFCEKGEFYDYGNAIYYYLKNNNIFSIEEEKEKDYILKAKEIVRGRYIDARINQRNGISVYEALAKLQNMERKDVKNEIKSEALNLAVIEYFKYLKANNIDFKEILYKKDEK